MFISAVRAKLQHNNITKVTCTYHVSAQLVSLEAVLRNGCTFGVSEVHKPNITAQTQKGGVGGSVGF